MPTVTECTGHKNTLQELRQELTCAHGALSIAAKRDPYGCNEAPTASEFDKLPNTRQSRTNLQQEGANQMTRVCQSRLDDDADIFAPRVAR